MSQLTDLIVKLGKEIDILKGKGDSETLKFAADSLQELLNQSSVEENSKKEVLLKQLVAAWKQIRIDDFESSTEVIYRPDQDFNLSLLRRYKIGYEKTKNSSLIDQLKNEHEFFHKVHDQITIIDKIRFSSELDGRSWGEERMNTLLEGLLKVAFLMSFYVRLKVGDDSYLDSIKKQHDQGGDMESIKKYSIGSLYNQNTNLFDSLKDEDTFLRRVHEDVVYAIDDLISNSQTEFQLGDQKKIALLESLLTVL